MRKFAITALAVLYTALILSATVTRTSEWVVQEAALLSHFASGQHSSVGTIAKSETQLSQKKIVERQFTVEMPMEVAAVLARSGRRALLLSFDSLAIWSGQPLSSRAPPSLA